MELAAEATEVALPLLTAAEVDDTVNELAVVLVNVGAAPVSEARSTAQITEVLRENILKAVKTMPKAAEMTLKEVEVI